MESITAPYSLIDGDLLPAVNVHSYRQSDLISDKFDCTITTLKLVWQFWKTCSLKISFQVIKGLFEFTFEVFFIEH